MRVKYPFSIALILISLFFFSCSDTPQQSDNLSGIHTQQGHSETCPDLYTADGVTFYELCSGPAMVVHAPCDGTVTWVDHPINITIGGRAYAIIVDSSGNVVIVQQ